MTRLSGDLYCNVCGAEIPAGEEPYEFDSPLLDKKGHSHGDCLAQRNAVVAQFDSAFKALSSLLDPGIESAPKIQQAAVVEGKRRPLKRHPRRQVQATPNTFTFDETSTHRPKGYAAKGRAKIVRPRASNAAALRRKAPKSKVSRKKRGA